MIHKSRYEAEEFNLKLHRRHSCYCGLYSEQRPRCNSQTVLSSIHPAFSLQPWAESARANAVHYLSFKAIMTHHPLFLPAPSKVISSPASHSLIGIQRLQENLSHLLSQVPLKRCVTAVELFIIYCTCTQYVSVQEDPNRAQCLAQYYVSLSPGRRRMSLLEDTEQSRVEHAAKET